MGQLGCWAGRLPGPPAMFFVKISEFENGLTDPQLEQLLAGVLAGVLAGGH